MKRESIQLRAMKFFLGVNKYTPIVGVRGECRWIGTKYEQWKNICKNLNKLQNLRELNCYTKYLAMIMQYAKTVGVQMLKLFSQN